MITSQKGIDFIKAHEGLRLNAYKALPSEEHYTIGYGHYGPDVSAAMSITIREAEQILKDDLKKFETYVTKTGKATTQGEFDALVSFSYNCGKGNLDKLVKNRSGKEIADAMLLYTKAGGKDIPGLVRRRKEERELFLSASKSVSELAQEVLDDKWGTGMERKMRLNAAGYDYAAVQAEVNRILKGGK